MIRIYVPRTFCVLAFIESLDKLCSVRCNDTIFKCTFFVIHSGIYIYIISVIFIQLFAIYNDITRHPGIKGNAGNYITLMCVKIFMRSTNIYEKASGL